MHTALRPTGNKLGELIRYSPVELDDESTFDLLHSILMRDRNALGGKLWMAVGAWVNSEVK